MTKVTYLSTRAPHFSIKLSDGPHQAVDGVLTLSETQSAELDELMTTRQDIRSMLKKVNYAAAAAQVKANQAARGPAAVSGPFTSQNRTAAAITAAKQAQTPGALTGQTNPVNTNANPPAAPIDVVEVKPNPPAAAGSSTTRFN